MPLNQPIRSRLVLKVTSIDGEPRSSKSILHWVPLVSTMEDVALSIEQSYPRVLKLAETPRYLTAPGVGAAAQEGGKVGKSWEWKNLRTPSVRPLWEGRMTGAVLEFCERQGSGALERRECPQRRKSVRLLRVRREGQASLRLYFFLRLSNVPFSLMCNLSGAVPFVFPYGGWGDEL